MAYGSIPPPYMSKLVQSIAVGAALGAVAHAAITIAEKRTAAGKPALPTALSAGLSGLIPLAKGIATEVLVVIERLEAPADGGDDYPQDHDTAAPGQDANPDTGLSSPPEE